VEASAIPASVGLARSRIAFGASLLRIRTDDQLVTLFRAGNDEAFRVIHDRYRARMLAYARQMLSSSGKDAEDAVQEVFMRAYHGLRASDRQLALRAWLYRIAHNRCIDELRRPQLLAIDAGGPASGGLQDPVAKVEQRDTLRRLISDVQQLPGQQRSALLMRELSGMSYSEVSGALGVTVPAVKSLLVRARVGLAQAGEARDTACSEIRADLITAHDRGVRTSGLARRHLRECHACREFRAEVRGVSRQLAALAPTLGPLGVIANLLGLGGGGGGAAAGGSAVVAGGSAVTAGSSAAAAHHSHRQSHIVHAARASGASGAVADSDGGAAVAGAAAVGGSAAGANGPIAPPALPGLIASGAGASTGHERGIPITEFLDPDMYFSHGPPPGSPAPPASVPNAGPATSPGTTSDAGTGAGTGAGASTTSGTGAGATGSGVTPGSGAPADTGSAPAPASSSSSTSAGGSSSSAASAGSSTSGSTAPTSTSSTSASATGSGASTSSNGSAGVGKSTTAASSGSVVSFIQHRRTRHRHRLDTLIPR
jgi:RNA polymerase sigma factor (sigma-70 family)